MKLARQQNEKVVRELADLINETKVGREASQAAVEHNRATFGKGTGKMKATLFGKVLASISKDGRAGRDGDGDGILDEGKDGGGSGSGGSGRGSEFGSDRANAGRFAAKSPLSIGRDESSWSEYEHAASSLNAAPPEVARDLADGKIDASLAARHVLAERQLNDYGQEDQNVKPSYVSSFPKDDKKWGTDHKLVDAFRSIPSDKLSYLARGGSKDGAFIGRSSLANRYLDRTGKPVRRKEALESNGFESFSKTLGKSFPFTKADDDKQIIYGWASVIKQDGKMVVDLQGDMIDEPELVKAAHEYITNARVAKMMHNGSQIGEVVESIVFTDDLQKALGIDLGKSGWFIGMKINDANIWKNQVKTGKMLAFSVGGSGQRVAVEPEA